MCELGAEESNWLMVDPWEADQPEYVPTAQVLDHFEHEINEVLGGAERPDGTRVKCRIALLAGADLIQTMCKCSVSYSIAGSRSDLAEDDSVVDLELYASCSAVSTSRIMLTLF